jgi:pSer/pThr/pTyr-binding forkhead associated (FHA) protein
MKKMYLAFENPLQPARTFLLLGTMIIGRSNESTIVLSDPMVSRSHARISLEKGQWILEDLGSANGTISDGQKNKYPTPEGPVLN